MKANSILRQRLKKETGWVKIRSQERAARMMLDKIIEIKKLSNSQNGKNRLTV